MNVDILHWLRASFFLIWRLKLKKDSIFSKNLKQSVLVLFCCFCILPSGLGCGLGLLKFVWFRELSTFEFYNGDASLKEYWVSKTKFGFWSVLFLWLIGLAADSYAFMAEVVCLLNLPWEIWFLSFKSCDFLNSDEQVAAVTNRDLNSFISIYLWARSDALLYTMRVTGPQVSRMLTAMVLSLSSSRSSSLQIAGILNS